jgi:hypothetical protein
MTQLALKDIVVLHIHDTVCPYKPLENMYGVCSPNTTLKLLKPLLSIAVIASSSMEYITVKRQIVTTLHTCSEMTYERYLFPEDMETLSGRILLGLYSCVQDFDSVRIIPSSDSQSQRSQQIQRRMFTVMPRVEVHVWHSDSYRNKRVDLYYVDPGSNPVNVKLLTSTMWNEITVQDFNH